MAEERYSIDQWAMDSWAGFGLSPQTTWSSGQVTEAAANSFTGYANAGYKRNGIVFGLIGVRMRLFSEARFAWQGFNGGRPDTLFSTADLRILERPWRNGTTADLLARMELDSSLAGSAYFYRNGDNLRRLRPDQVDVILGSTSQNDDGLDVEPAGYAWWPKGRGTGEPITLLPEQVVAFAPSPDPDAEFRGMSWLTPVLEEIRSDTAMTIHKGKFLDNAATPNMVVSMKEALTKEKYVEFVEEMRKHEGAANAYRTLWLANGADVKIVGADLEQLDFKVVQGSGETRIAAASGIAPLIAGLSEGLMSATYSNYGQARRSVSDIWLRPQWRAAAGALESVLTVPSDAGRLWYDERDVPFLQEDLKDDADIAAQRMATIRQGVDAGYEPASVVAAVDANDFSKLVHSGLYSVQLQAPGSGTPGEAPQGERLSPLDQALLLQKLYLSVGVVVSTEEARQIAAEGGVNLPTELPAELSPAAPAAPVPAP